MTEAVAVKKPPSSRKATKGVARAKIAPKAVKKPVEASKTAFAVISTGGKQYKVKPGQKLKIEKLLGDHKEGDMLVFREVLLKGDGDALSIGTPLVSGSSVQATITKIGRYKTIDVIHYKQKSRYFKKYGHRQPFFEVKIDNIQ